jgi:hypothetical protein
MRQNKATSKSTLLVQHIGIPGNHERPSSQLRNEDFQSFLQLAEKNKIPLLFLQTVNCNHNIQLILSHYEDRYKNTLNLITYTADLLEKLKVPYTLFKTLKPFPYTPSDIDILLWSDENLQTVTETLKNRGCILLEKDDYGLTMFSPKHKMNIDLTTQIAVSGLVYVNKKLLFDHLCKVEVNEASVQTLEPTVELLVIAAHGIFKEQTYTLSDYYTFAMFTQYWKEAKKLAENFYLEHAFGMALRMTKRVTADSFGSTSALMKKFVEVGAVNVLETCGEEYELPKKYDSTFLMMTFLEKIIEDPVSKQSLPRMMRSISNPAFYKKIVGHATRKTY